MKTFAIAALAGLAFAHPAVAAPVLGDYDIYASGNVYISGGHNGDIAAGSFFNANGPGPQNNYASQAASTAALNGQAAALSAALAGQAATGSFSEQWGAGTLTGTQSGTNVFNISVSQLSPLYKLTFAGLGDGAVVNITGTGALMTSIKFDYGAITDPAKVVLNFVDLDSVWLNGVDLKGSILAVDAAVRLQGGTIGGTVVAGSAHAEGATIGGAGFGGFFGGAPAVPEPSTWALLVLGFGLVGAALRRRARPAGLVRA